MLLDFFKFYIKHPLKLFVNLYYRIRSVFITEKYDLIVLDNVFPNPISAFRYEEFVSYIKHFGDRICIYTLDFQFNKNYEQKNNFIKQFIKENPNYKLRVKKYEYHRKVSAKLAYSLFVDNTYSYLEFYKKNNIPFAFTLYPGAGFFLNQKTTDDKLKKIMSSSLYRGVITTQKISTEYISQKNFCNKELVNFIYGVVTPRIFLNQQLKSKEVDLGVLNIAFVANKQMKRGYDKGYDIFVEVTKTLLKKNYNIVCHIVGPFDNTDIDIFGFENNFRFYGFLKTSEFQEFYNDVDLIVSPNRVFVLKLGAFDGFPTAAVTEAVLNGVPAMVTDPLNQNIFFMNNENIIIIKSELEDIYEKVDFFYHNRDKLREIGLKGREVFLDVYSFEKQVKPRIEFLENILN